MSNQKQLGVDEQLTDLVKSATRSNGYSSEAMRLAAVGLTLIREMLPQQAMESDEAAKLRLELMAELAEEIGEQRFVRAVRDAIKVSHRRWDCSIARIRECAGLRYTPPLSAAAQAWEFVTQVFVDHCRTDADGNYHLEDKVTIKNGLYYKTPVPPIPPAIKRAIQALGGWAALAESWPEYMSAKYRDFRELYHEGDNLCIDSKPGTGLEKAG